MFIEVSHGPYIVDHNILASAYALDNYAQGGAYLNNLICGKMVHRKILNRSTPYHVPHSTELAGFAVVQGGDDRFYNNIFIGDESSDGVMGTAKNDGTEGVGTAHFNGYTTTLEEYLERLHQKPGDLEIFLDVDQPVYINDHAYLNGAEAFERESKKLVADDFNPAISITEEGNQVYLTVELPDDFEESLGEIPSTKTLGRVRFVDANFENPDGNDVKVDTDLLGVQKVEVSRLGPIAHLQKGKTE